MLYEKLQNTYRETNMYRFFPFYLIDEFFKYTSKQKRRNKEYLSPYRFANENNLAVNDAVKFFLYLTGENRVLDIKYFFECSNMSCGHRIFFSKEEFKDLNSLNGENLIICDECEKRYDYQDIKTFIKAYFVLNPEDSSYGQLDRNSTFGALEEMSYIEGVSPSSTHEENAESEDEDEGDNAGLNLQVLSELNRTPNGDIISLSFEETMRLVNGFIKK